MSGEKMFQYNPDTNYDEATILQQQRIEREIAQKQPYISDKLDFSSLDIDYKADSIYLAKVRDLRTKYSQFRRTRGDGNCFYRAFGFAYMELLLQDAEECARFKEKVEKNKQILLEFGYPEFTLEDFHENFVDVIDNVGKNCTVDELQTLYNDQGCSDYLVVYLRLLVSGYLQKEAAFFSNFLDGDVTVKEFCNQEVEPMCKESDHIHISALTSAIQVPVRVEYMDRAGTSTISHDFCEEQSPKVFLLYRPSHYDILYKLV